MNRRFYQTIDAHAAGEPLRIVVSGAPPIPGRTMLEKRRHFRQNYDHVRTTLMHEPRGHRDMYGCVLTSPVSEGAEFGVLFMHNEGYSTMCGHGVIALVTVLSAQGMLRDPGHVVLDTPAGVVTASAEIQDGCARRVSFQNVPSFVLERDIAVEGLSADIVFGGAFYVLAASPLPIDGLHLDELRRLGMRMKQAVEAKWHVRHPMEPGLEGVYGTIFTSSPSHPSAHLRNVTIFADAEVDRSPCGTGTCATMASRVERGLLVEQEWFVYESIIGTVFEGRVLGQTRVGALPAIVPEIRGSASITGFNTFVVDPDDPIGRGFRI